MAFQHLGYFEEFILKRDGCAPKALGVRVFDLVLPNEQAGRTLGVAGRRDFNLTEPIELQKGHRLVQYKASSKRPMPVMTMLQKLEGKTI